jgi:hypothetical protein
MDYFSRFLRPGQEAAAPKSVPDYAQEFHKAWTFVKVAACTTVHELNNGLACNHRTH